ncbi:type II toxin-antitoxin system VapC family toxin [Actinomycetospora sp. CA-084318]|uniref:type II toxin-antitoxin system VapC family toxin n=1 Tax=Actinomycetospora sp. CA-084318 TaxID=3239892 RepID=UPI003D974021
MIVDSSALVAILRREEDAERYARALAASSRTRVSAATYLEVAIVIDGHREPVLSRTLDALLQTAAIEIVDLTARQAEIARQAHRDFGRGSGHPAKLNYGDCFSYALAIETGEPLLYKGDDFVHTGVRSAVPR